MDTAMDATMVTVTVTVTVIIPVTVMITIMASKYTKILNMETMSTTRRRPKITT